MPAPLLQKLESDRQFQQQRDLLVAQVAHQVQELHHIFVQWFRGTRPLKELQVALKARLMPHFSHVAPNGQFLAGRQVLLGHLQDKYGCYKDRVFEIDIYNVQVIWTDANKCLVTYEEWQSWQRDEEEEEEEDDVGGGGGGGEHHHQAAAGTQQFGRLSTCLMEQAQPYRWIHVHETWLEEETPAPTARKASDVVAASNEALEDDTIMTGPVMPPSSSKQSLTKSLHLPPPAGPGVAGKSAAAAYANSSGNNNDSDDDDSDEGYDVLPPLPSAAVALNGGGAVNMDHDLVVLISKQAVSANQDKVIDLLQQHQIPYETVDGSDPEQRARRQILFGISRLPGQYPQLFLVHKADKTTTFWGDWGRFEQANRNGTLNQELGSGGAAVVAPAAVTEESSSSDDSNVMVGAAAAVAGGAVAATLINRNNEDRNGSFSNAAPEWATAGSEHTARDHPASSSNDSAEGSFHGDSGSNDVLFFEPEPAASPNNKDEGSETNDELENMGANGEKKADHQTADTVENLDDLAPQEAAFLQASKGILVFEDEDLFSDEGGPSAQTEAKTEMEILPLIAEKTETSIPNDISSKRHISPKLEKYAKPMMWEGALVGITVAGFDIGSSQGPMADEAWYKENGARMEDMAQSYSIPKPRRRICLPEMVFPVAHVALAGNGVWLSWDANDALETWAQCHRMIAVLSRIGWNGVNVIRSNDAKKWEKNRKHISSEEAAAAVFHYDWTYSTPYCGTLQGGEWVELDVSGMRMELLTDLTVPILFFDEIVLYEDDLHDIGQAEYTVKLRVMPTCAYILARLWVRVDNVIIRLRETRILLDLFGMKPQIFRDVTWRECAWDDLQRHGLPTDVRSWQHNGPENQAWHAQMQALPEVEPPKEVVMKHAVLEYFGEPSGEVEL